MFPIRLSIFWHFLPSTFCRLLETMFVIARDTLALEDLVLLAPAVLPKLVRVDLLTLE